MFIYTTVLFCTRVRAHTFCQKWNPKLMSKRATSVTKVANSCTNSTCLLEEEHPPIK